MNRTIDRLKVIFMSVFAVLVVGVVVWQVGWAMPQKKCEQDQKKWWDGSTRVCATPVLISDITGRTIQDKQAEAAAMKAIGREPKATSRP